MIAHTIKTTCSVCGSPAELDTAGIYTGIWECLNPECVASDTHEHDNIVTEEVEKAIFRNGEVDTYTATSTYCATCNMELEGDY